MTCLYSLEVFQLFKEKLTQGKVSWSIVWELPENFQTISGFEISRFKNMGHRSAFEFGSAYINVENSQKQTFTYLFHALVEELKDDHVALANLFVVYWSVSATDNFEKTILKIFKEGLGSKSEVVYKELIAALNSEYRKNHHLQKKNMIERVEDWLDIFRSAQYFSDHNDPILSVIDLVRKQIGKIDYSFLLPMRPILRAVLVELYGFEIETSMPFLLEEISTSTHEATFLAAIILQDIAPTAKPPIWLNAKILEALVVNYWQEVGIRYLIHVYGLSYRNRNQNQIFVQLREILNPIIASVFSDSSGINWQKSMEFPHAYIAIFEWLKEDHDNDLSDKTLTLLRSQLILEISQIVDSASEAISGNNKDAFFSHSYGENKYLNTLPHLLILLLESSSSEIKKIQNVLFALKPLFYGGYSASHFAGKCVEFLLLVFTSLIQISGLKVAHLHILSEFLDMICQLVIVPYIHITERRDEIWDVAGNREVASFNLSLMLINTRLQKVVNGPYSNEFKKFFQYVNSVKVVNWPFQSIADLEKHYVVKHY